MVPFTIFDDIGTPTCQMCNYKPGVSEALLDSYIVHVGTCTTYMYMLLYRKANPLQIIIVRIMILPRCLDFLTANLEVANTE